MYTIIKRVALFAVMVVLGTSFARPPQASASASSASTDGHVDSERVASQIGLGASQEARCNAMAPNDRIAYEECASAKHILTLMSAERRDDVWADKMESELRTWVEGLASDGFTLKRVKCRLSWCLLEVGSAQGRILEMNLRVAQRRKLFELKDLFAPEIDDVNVQDQLIIFKRYCDSVKDVLGPNSHVVPNIAAVGQKC